MEFLFCHDRGKSFRGYKKRGRMNGPFETREIIR